MIREKKEKEIGAGNLALRRYAADATTLYPLLHARAVCIRSRGKNGCLMELNCLRSTQNICTGAPMCAFISSALTKG
jgi:hypothetical protein